MNDYDLPEYKALNAALDQLARLRADLDDKQAALDSAKAELMPYEVAVKRAKEAERAAYEIAVAASLAIKDAYGDLTPVPDEVTIALVTKAVYDEDAMLKYALENGLYDLLKIELRASKVLDALKNGTLTSEQGRVEIAYQPRIASKLGHRLMRDAAANDNDKTA